MKKKIFIYIIAAIVAVAILATSVFTLTKDNPIEPMSLPELDFTYTDSNLKLKQNLESREISMSSPLKFSTISDLNKFCAFFENTQLQNQVEYCTSTELRDSEGNYLGNIHMVGNRQMPKIVLSLIQSNPFMDNLDSVKTVYDTVIQDLVCNCWIDVKPGSFETVSDWIDKQREFHTSGTKPTSKSSLNLSGKQLEMELTTNTQGYLWKLLIMG